MSAIQRLDEVEGRTVPPLLPVIPGHQVVGHVRELGADCHRFQLGQRVGVGWIYSSGGDQDENLSPAFRATGRDAHGGYSEYMTVPEGYAHSIPDCFCRDKASLLRLDHEKHVWLEHEIKSVANRTQHDIREFLLLAAEIPLQPKVTCYRLDDANRALLDLKRGRIQGSKVPRITP